MVSLTILFRSCFTLNGLPYHIRKIAGNHRIDLHVSVLPRQKQILCLYGQLFYLFSGSRIFHRLIPPAILKNVHLNDSVITELLLTSNFQDKEFSPPLLTTLVSLASDRIKRMRGVNCSHSSNMNKDPSGSFLPEYPAYFRTLCSEMYYASTSHM